MSELRDRLDALSPEKRALLERHLLSRARSPDPDAIVPRDRSRPARLSYAQQRLWFLDQLAPGDPAYNACIALRLRGGLDLNRLRRAFEAVVQRHEAVRTVFRPGADGEPEQVVLADWTLPWQVVDAAEEQVVPLAREACRRPYDLAADVMLRLLVLRLGPDDHVLVVGEHHVAFDGWSDGVMFDEVAECYVAQGEGREPVLPALPVQYADVAAWQRDRLSGPRRAALDAFWRDRLAGLPDVLALPWDAPRPATQTFSGQHHPISLDAALAARVGVRCREWSVTPYMTLLAGFVALLHRWSGATDIAVGTPVASRDRVETERLVGFFSNTMVLRVDVAGDPSFAELVARVRRTALAAYEHHDLPFDAVVEAVRPPRNPSRNPLFQVNFRVQTGEPPLLRLPGVEVAPVAVDLGFSRFDLAVELQLGDDGLGGYLERNDALFSAGTGRALTAELGVLLDAALSEPALPLSALPFGEALAQARADTGGIRGARRRR